jgi:hypothetical protein
MERPFCGCLIVQATKNQMENLVTLAVTTAPGPGTAPCSFSRLTSIVGLCQRREAAPKAKIIHKDNNKDKDNNSNILLDSLETVTITATGTVTV